ncbi:glycosyltransferase [Marinobacter sp. SS13-12]|uniref:glycosyltransferase n=1 Tax=Marinobacter sp. SS13-12 TaxID=3050451 RepID=UPI002553323C|nr:glycosyltransferase [Marinobacter sp. SS13-12]MDK8464266.1 glycosyltransferase [Marinobacter sp. SS13-12]
MKIGYLYDLQAYPPKGGNHIHVFELIRGFVESGHEVAVLGDPTMPDVRNFDGESDASVSTFVAFCDVIYARVDSRSLERWGHLRKAMQEVDSSVPVVWEINSPADENLAFSWLGGRKAGQSESWFRWLRRWFHAARQTPGIRREERFRKQLAQRVDAAVCVSSSMGRYAGNNLGIGQVVVAPNGGPLVPEEEIIRRRNNRENDKFTVFYSGSAIYPWQGLDLLAAAIELAKTEAPDIRFVLAVNQRSDNLPQGDNVEIKEKIPRDEVLDEICSADVCIALHPDWYWTPHGVHGSPTKLWEYMACMTPVVTSNRGQMAELIQHEKNGLLSSDEPADILAQLLRLRDDPDLAEAVGRAGWELVQEKLNWPNVARETLDTFQQSIQRRTGAR